MSYMTREELDRYLKSISSKQQKSSDSSSTTAPLPRAHRNSLTGPRPPTHGQPKRPDPDPSSRRPLPTPPKPSSLRGFPPIIRGDMQGQGSGTGMGRSLSYSAGERDPGESRQYPMPSATPSQSGAADSQARHPVPPPHSNTTNTQSPPKEQVSRQLPSKSQGPPPNRSEDRGAYRSIDDLMNDITLPSLANLTLASPSTSSNKREDPTEKGLPPTPRTVFAGAANDNKSTEQWTTPQAKNAAMKYPSVAQMESNETQPPIPSISVGDNAAPTSIPSISVGPIPTISFGDSAGDAEAEKRPIASTLSAAGLKCAGCGEHIRGIVVTALGKSWHPDHFICKHCGQSLEHIAYYERDGYPYCHVDYHELFSPRCEYCKTPIEDQCLTALGKTYHPGHFFCRECGSPFESGGFMVHEGHPYCEKCHTKKFAVRCRRCNIMITEDYVQAIGGQWHKKCFVCMDCFEPFEDGRFFVRQNLPYCERHFRMHLGYVCEKCRMPIEGRAITALGKKWHPEHFVCCACEEVIVDGNFRERLGKVYCQKCGVAKR
ncbi:uncharacterized protein VTP21DRAFT_3563 [Calcarisporiella thermophila]|uniref:uncharacterized protein n=1 Tax=Calcarisporiella thermophila TaxID=911321 RepID=UPI0037438F48